MKYIFFTKDKKKKCLSMEGINEHFVKEHSCRNGLRFDFICKLYQCHVGVVSFRCLFLSFIFLEMPTEMKVEEHVGLTA